MITTHQYLSLYPIAPDSRRLIVGTIHPHHHDKFIIPFFYGNKMSLWNLLSDAFPGELPKPVDLDGVLGFLRKRKIAVSDTIMEARRLNPTALDQDLEPLQLHHDLIEQIHNSAITEIFFTSGFQKNNAFKLFYVDILKQRITKEIRQNKEVVLDKKFFGRPVKLVILFSPSGASNIALAQSAIYKKNKWKYEKSVRPVYDFKVDYYRSVFG